MHAENLRVIDKAFMITLSIHSVSQRFDPELQRSNKAFARKPITQVATTSNESRHTYM